MSAPTTQIHALNIRHYVEGVARQPLALEQLLLSLQSLPDAWRSLAMHRLHMRQTALLDVMSDVELEVIGTGQVDLLSLAQLVATAQANGDPLTDPEGDESTDSLILETIELISQRKLGHTTVTRNRDSLDFFEVNAASVQAALVTAFVAGMQFKKAC